MQHIEQAGVHSGDSACSIPPYSLNPKIVEEVKRQTRVMAKALNVVGLMNVQFAIQNAFTDHPEIYVLEVNPRASELFLLFLNLPASSWPKLQPVAWLVRH